MKLKKAKIAINSQDLRFVIDHFGKDAQRHKAIEELNELAVALAHDDRANIQEEMADVWLMLLQMMTVFNISEGSIFAAMAYKLQRTMKRIEQEEYNDK